MKPTSKERARRTAHNLKRMLHADRLIAWNQAVSEGRVIRYQQIGTFKSFPTIGAAHAELMRACSNGIKANIVAPAWGEIPQWHFHMVNEGGEPMACEKSECVWVCEHGASPIDENPCEDCK